MILEPKKRKSVTAFTFLPSICHEATGQGSVGLYFPIYPDPSFLFQWLLWENGMSVVYLPSAWMMSPLRSRAMMYQRPLTLISTVLALSLPSSRLLPINKTKQPTSVTTNTAKPPNHPNLYLVLRKFYFVPKLIHVLIDAKAYDWPPPCHCFKYVFVS